MDYTVLYIPVILISSCHLQKGKTMSSTSKIIRDAILQSMEDDVVYTNSELKDFIHKKTGMRYGIEYQESHFAGCMATLRRKAQIEQVEYGKHRKSNTPTSVSLCTDTASNTISMDEAKERILASIQNEINYLKEITESIALDFDTADKEGQNIQEIKKLIQSLKDFTFH